MNEKVCYTCGNGGEVTRSVDGGKNCRGNEMPEFSMNATLYLSNNGDYLTAFNKEKTSVTVLERK